MKDKQIIKKIFEDIEKFEKTLPHPIGRFQVWSFFEELRKKYSNNKITTQDDCIKINSKDILNKSIKTLNKGETFYLKDNKLYCLNGLFGLSFVGYNKVKK